MDDTKISIDGDVLGIDDTGIAEDGGKFWGIQDPRIY